LNSLSESQKNTIQRIVEGSLRLSTTEEFEKLIEQFSDNPDIHREYADFLVQKKDTEAAYQAYNKTADLYIQANKALQAIVAKIRAWSIVKPNHEQGRSFHGSVQKTTPGESPLQAFFAEMSYPEFIGIMLRMIRVRFPADQFVVKYGDPGNDIFFIVSGTIEEMTHVPTNKRGESPSTSIKFLSDNDIFGEAFPLDQFNISKSDIKTVTAVELVKIKKPILTDIIKKHQGIEKLLENLYKGPTEGVQGRTWTSVRRSVRHEIPIKVNLKIFPADDEIELESVGYTKDISLGGACIELEEKHWGVSNETIVDSDAMLNIYLPNVDEFLEITGTVLWIRKDTQKDKNLSLIGIQFKTLSDADRDFLDEYCFGSDGEQNLIWDLWETYVK
jgi:PilZ domain/Cyclic nucleotide-binding domain